MALYSGESSFLYGVNETYLAELYARYLKDPGSVDPSWAEIFESLGDDQKALLGELHGASWAPRQTTVIGINGQQPTMADATAGGSDPGNVDQARRPSLMDDLADG